MSRCPCDSNNDYLACCGRFIEHKAIPTTPEELMRSRYTAYYLGDLKYIKATMRPPASKGFKEKSVAAWLQQIKWLQLEVLSASSSGNQGKVEFIAHYLIGAERMQLHELSKFKLMSGRWYYIDGKEPRIQEPLIGQQRTARK